RENAGLLILSEFAGAAEELFGALLVNPYDTSAVAKTLSAALKLPTEARQARNQAMRKHIIRCDAKEWAGSFIHDLISCRASDSVLVDTEIGAASSQIARALSEGQSVALFVDYDGTLREIETDPEIAEPTPQLHALLHRMSNRPNLLTAIISGRAQDDL